VARVGRAASPSANSAGGMGLRALSLVGPAAFLGSGALVLPQVQRFLGTWVDLSGDGREAERVRWAEGLWADAAGVQRGRAVDWAAVASSSVGISKVQRRLSLALDDAQIARFRQLRPAADWVRLRNCGGDWASLWLSVPPAEHGLSLLDVEYAAMVRWRLRLPLRAGMRALCERAFDAFGDHAPSSDSVDRT
jgi:hypothetical protein